MKKYLLALMLVLSLCLPTIGFALGDINTNTNTNANTNANTNVVAPVTTNLNTNLNSSMSGSKSRADAFSGGNVQTVESTQQYLVAPPIFPLTLPLIQNGRVGDVTKSIPKFAIAAKPYNGELVVKVLKVVTGIKVEKLETELLAAYKDVAANTSKVNPSNIRYTVTYKDSATSWGIGGGGAGSASAINGGAPYGASGAVAVLPTYGRSTADPKFIIKFFLID